MSHHRTLLITGGASEISAATAIRFAADGYRVVIADQDEHAAFALKGKLNKRFGNDCADYICTDVSKKEQVDAMVAFTQRRFGSLDVLVNNASMNDSKATSPVLNTHWQRVMNVNLNAVFWASQAASEIMLKQGAGVIINTASTASFSANCAKRSYRISKEAVINFTRSMARELFNDNIRVNAVCPDEIETSICSNLIKENTTQESNIENMPMAQLDKNNHIANVIRFLSTDEASSMTGLAVPIDREAKLGQSSNNYKEENASDSPTIVSHW